MEPKVQTGLRIPEKKYSQLNELAQEIGISLNSLALILINIGLETVNLGIPEEARSLLRNLQDISE